MKTYLFFVFAAHQVNQEVFVNDIADQILSGSGRDVKYFYGDEAIIYTFKSSEPTQELKKYFEETIGSMQITFFLTPYDPDNIAFYLDKTAKEHLFGTDKMTDTSSGQSMKDCLASDLFGEYFNNSLMEEFGDDCEYDFFTKKEKTENLTLDDLLDKINYGGMSALSEKELILLNKYSNQ